MITIIYYLGLIRNNEWVANLLRMNTNTTTLQKRSRTRGGTLEKITSEQNAIIMSLCPALAGVIQQFVFHDVKIEQGIIYILYSITLACFYFAGKLTQKLEIKA